MLATSAWVADGSRTTKITSISVSHVQRYYGETMKQPSKIFFRDVHNTTIAPVTHCSEYCIVHWMTTIASDCDNLSAQYMYSLASLSNPFNGLTAGANHKVTGCFIVGL